jgi:Glycosyl hydrolases family 43
MKPFLITTLFTFFVFIVFAQQQDSAFVFAYFKNNGQDGLHLAYSTDGFNWQALKNDSSFLTPAVSKDKLMRDPCIIRGADGKFHMVWTVSWNDRGIGYASSSDLVNWSEQQFVPVMMQEDSARNCWAPEITYDAKKKRYMIYWATTIRGKYPSDPLVESGYNHRMYYVLTKDFQTYTQTKLLYDKGFNVIDATIVTHGKRYIMFLKDETRTPPQKNIKIAYSSNLHKGYTAASQPLTGNYWAEGPTAIRVNNLWLVYFDKYRDHKFGAIQSADLKNWADVSDKINLPKGIRHGSILKITKEELKKLLAIN